MKKTLFALMLAVVASTGIAQVYNSDVQQDVRDFISAAGCTYLSVDTVTLPVRQALATDYAITLSQREILSKLDKPGDNLSAILEESYATLGNHLARLQELCRDYDNPKLASNIGYDYQRVRAKTQEGKVINIYTQVGSSTISELATFDFNKTINASLGKIMQTRELLDAYRELYLE